MIIFELIGHTAAIDWGDRSMPVRIALFSTREKAEEHIEKIKAYANWRMDWDKFSITELTVN